MAHISGSSGVSGKKLAGAIRNTEKVEDVHDLHIWSLSSTDIALSYHICVEEKHFQEGPDIVTCINRMLRDRFRIDHGTIQLERVDSRRSDALCSQNNRHKE